MKHLALVLLLTACESEDSCKLPPPCDCAAEVSSALLKAASPARETVIEDIPEEEEEEEVYFDVVCYSGGQEIYRNSKVLDYVHHDAGSFQFTEKLSEKEEIYVVVSGECVIK
jgi:hypothetical protein